MPICTKELMDKKVMDLLWRRGLDREIQPGTTPTGEPQRVSKLILEGLWSSRGLIG